MLIQLQLYLAEQDWFFFIAFKIVFLMFAVQETHTELSSDETSSLSDSV